MMAKIKHTPVIIIGGGISGLIVAAMLEKANQDYMIIEAQAEFGGMMKGQMEHGVWLDYGLKSIPLGESISDNPLVLLKNKLDLRFQIESWTDPAKTFDKKGFSDFVGFGETKSRLLVDELEYYMQSPRLIVAGGWRNLTAELVGMIPEKKVITRAIATKFEFEGEKITSVLVNGETVMTADRFVLTMPPEHLNDLVPLGKMSGKTVQRIAKAEPWTAVSIDIATEKNVSSSKNIYILKDAAEDGSYVLGQFVSNADPIRQTANLQLSTWMTLIDPESSLNDEMISKVIKTMKKTIRKAFPEIIDNNSWERLLVVPQALGQYEQLALEKDLTLPGVKNLYLTGSQLRAAKRNLVSAISSALNLSEVLTPISQSREVYPVSPTPSGSEVSIVESSSETSF